MIPKHSILLLTLVFCLPVITLAQSLARSSINSLGSSVTQDNTLIRQSAGQSAIVGTVENGVVLRQGFQQPISKRMYFGTNSNFQLEVFPVPAVDEFTFQVVGLVGEYSYRLQDIQGKSVLSENSSEEKQVVKSNHLSPGIYLLTIFQDQVILGAKKIIITKN